MTRGSARRGFPRTAQVPLPRWGAAALLLLFAAGIRLLAGCAGAPRGVPPPGMPPEPRGGPPAVSRPGEPPAPARPSPEGGAPPSAGISLPRFLRVLLVPGARSLALEGRTVRAWSADGRLLAEGSERILLSAVGERIRWGGSKLLGDAFDAAGTPELRVAGRHAGGRVRIFARKGELFAVAAVPLETYVAAVVSREAGPRFHPEALAALAVAVRTYAAGAALAPRDPSYDLAGTVEDQVFDGVDGVSPAYREAAERTLGMTLMYRGRVAQAVFHSTCGGRTESALSAWGRDVPYLQALPCDDCSGSPAYRWEYRMPAAEGRRLAKELGVPPGKDLRFLITGRTPTGRASRLRIVSGGISRELKASEFRKAAGYAKVRSLRMEISPDASGWRFTGQGYGHGVGMCQFGADGMARRGEGFRAILARYYPGTDVAGAVR